MVTGILQSISEDLYEAAKIDGANAWQRFSNITLPAVFLVAAPTFITQYTGNFNNFSMIYLFNNGGPGSVGGGAGSTDILISWIYKLTTGTSPQYSMASAITLIISVIVICVSLLVFKRQMRSIWGLTMKNFIRVLDSKTTFSLFTYFFF